MSSSHEIQGTTSRKDYADKRDDVGRDFNPWFTMLLNIETNDERNYVSLKNINVYQVEFKSPVLRRGNNSSYGGVTITYIKICNFYGNRKKKIVL